MEPDAFATRFEQLFRRTFALAARRVRDKREIVPVETLALLDHMAALGPATLTELTRHLDRAPSTLSEMLEPLVARGWIERERDPEDGRRYLLWLTALGQSVRLAEQQVLDRRLLAEAARLLSPEETTGLIAGLEALATSLATREHEHDGHA